MPEKFVNLIVLILVLLRIASSYTLPKRLTSPKLSWRVWRQSKKSESEVPPPSLICDLEPEQCDWECAEDASCTLVPTKSSISPARHEQDYHKYEAEELKRGENVREKKIVRINDRWVDLTAWRLQHPAGAHWIDAFHGRDATEVVTAFHSGEAMAMVDRLPRAKAADVTAAVAAAASDVTFGQSISTTGVGVSSKSTSSSDVEFQVGARTAATAVFSVDPEGRVANAQQIKNMNRNAIKDPKASNVSSFSSKSLRDPTALSLRAEPEVSSLTRAFRKWRAELVAEGWFKRDPLWEAYQLASWAAVCGLGVLLANSGSGGWARAVISRATNHLGAFFLSGTAAAAAHSTTAVTVAAKSAGSGTGATILRTFDVTEAISRIAKVLMTVLHKASSSIAGLDPRLFPLLSVVPLAFSNSYAGWLAHDYCHGTDRFCNAMRQFGAFAAGLGTIMWGEKHNLHHARTNEVGVDTDLPGGPVLFIWPPSPENDKPWRRYQHLYLPFAYSLLFVIWRVDSIKVAWSRLAAGNANGGANGGLGLRKAANGANTNSPRNELLSLAAHYCFVLALLPPPVFVASVLLSGLISATIVTVSHQTEDLILEREDDWVLNQFVSTRDARTSNPLSEWLWGGMQYQLIHHLMPTMPRYRYKKIKPLVKQFAMDNDVDYRDMDEIPLVLRNIALYREVARAPADSTARSSSGGVSV